MVRRSQWQIGRIGPGAGMNEDHDQLNRMAAATLIAEAWNEVLEDWNDAERHHRYVALCDELDALDLAATRYAEARKERPGDPFSRKMHEQILFRASMRLEPAGKGPKKGTDFKTKV